jgi:hypothetical protein
MAAMMTALSLGALLTPDVVPGFFVLGFFVSGFFPVCRYTGLRFIMLVGTGAGGGRQQHNRQKNTDCQKPHCLLLVLFF